MNIHKNARLTPLRREEMAFDVIEGHPSQAQAAQVDGVSVKIVSRRVERFKAGGPRPCSIALPERMPFPSRRIRC